MATSALSELPPPPPPTSDALDIYSTPPRTPYKELDDSINKCLLPFIESSTSRGGEFQPATMTNDFLPTDLLFALKRQDKSVAQHRGATPPREPQSAGVNHGIKAPAKLWGYSSRRGRLKHLTKEPPCICGAGRDISFLYDSPPSERRKVTKRVSYCISEA